MQGVVAGEVESTAPFEDMDVAARWAARYVFDASDGNGVIYDIQSGTRIATIGGFRNLMTNKDVFAEWMTMKNSVLGTALRPDIPCTGLLPGIAMCSSTTTGTQAQHIPKARLARHRRHHSTVYRLRHPARTRKRRKGRHIRLDRALAHTPT